MYNDNDDDNNDNNEDIVIVEEVNEDKHDGPDNQDYSQQGIFGQYTNYGYTSHKITTDEGSIDTKGTVNTNEETKTNNPFDHSKRDVPTNTNNDR